MTRQEERMSLRALTVAALLAVPSVGGAQDASPLLGVWKVQEIAVTGPRPSTISNPQPGYWVFTPGYYSIVMINSSTPRPRFEGSSEPESPTPAEKAARYDQWSLLAAQAGSYKRQGTTITARPLVAKNEVVMSGPERTLDFQLDGNTLSMTLRPAPAQPPVEIRWKLVRVE
jgi:hypothetical protein